MCHRLVGVDGGGKILFFKIFLNNEKKCFSIASVPTLWYLSRLTSVIVLHFLYTTQNGESLNHLLSTVVEMRTQWRRLFLNL